MFAFCGHGGDDFIYCEDEKCIKFSEIVKVTGISNFSSLENIPRLFFFDISRNPETVVYTEDRKWQSQISNIDNILVAFSTSTGYQVLESTEGSLWIGMLANKLTTCAKDIRYVIVEANEELIAIMQSKGILCLQQPELYDKLNTTVNLLDESGS